jgi:glucokinase
MRKILSADIGGTNSRFAYFKCGSDDRLSLVESKWLKTRGASSFADLLNQLKAREFSLPFEQVEAAVFAVAGPVERGTYSKPPHIPWGIDVSNVCDEFGLKKCELINDFVAQAYACRSPVIQSAERIVPGDIRPEAALVVIGAGTGLGQAALLPCRDGGYVPLPSEGGHTSFPFESEKEFGYMEFLLKTLEVPYVTTETVVSGRGLSLLHQFLTGERLEPAQVASRLREDSEVLRLMARFYGRVCRNYAFQFLARGGVYIAGGVAAKTPIIVTHGAFVSEFHRAETNMFHVLKHIPVFLNSNEESGLWGAALRGMHQLQMAP